MSLVAYESSDGSDHESEEETNNNEESCQMTPSADKPAANPHSLSEGNVSKDHSDADDGSTNKGLFSLLPAPKHHYTPLKVERIMEKSSQKKETVKIVIPSIKEFQDDDDEEKCKVKRKPSEAGSGLMSLLPKPQNLTLKESAKQLVPLSVSRKHENLQAKAVAKPSNPDLSTNTSATVSAISKSSSPAQNVQEGNASDEETFTDFFSLSATQEADLSEAQSDPNSTSNLSETLSSHETELFPSDSFASSFENKSSSSSEILSSNSKEQNINYNSMTECEYSSCYPQNQEYYESANSQQSDWMEKAPDNLEVSSLKNEAFVRLAGKKRSAQENIEFVDVNGDDLMAGREEWLLKSLSEQDNYQPAPKRSDQPSAMHRRKHQITYLAFQAKAREQELKNQWSMNRMTKKQTQSKYGF